MRNFNSSRRVGHLAEGLGKISGSVPSPLAFWIPGQAQLNDYYRQQEAEARASILSQVLTPEAADRLGRIRLVKESRATDVENRLIMLARSGQLRSKVTEEQLKELLGAMTENAEKGGGGGGRIVITRRKDWDDDDDLLDL